MRFHIRLGSEGTIPFELNAVINTAWRWYVLSYHRGGDSPYPDCRLRGEDGVYVHLVLSTSPREWFSGTEDEGREALMRQGWAAEDAQQYLVSLPWARPWGEGDECLDGSVGKLSR